MSGGLAPHRLAEYRRKLRDPCYFAHALAQVASALADVLVLDRRPLRRDDREGDSWQVNGCAN